MLIDLHADDNAAVKEKSDSLYRELHSEMRAIRDTELKFVTLYYQVCAFIVAGDLYITTQQANRNLYISIQIGMLILIAAFGTICWRRIEKDHASYRWLGVRITTIRSIWGVERLFFSETRPPLGEGMGYKTTQLTVVVTGIFVGWIVAVSVVAKTGLLGG